MARTSRVGSDTVSPPTMVKIHRHLTSFILKGTSSLRVNFLREAIYSYIWNFEGDPRLSPEAIEFRKDLRATMIDSIVRDPVTWGYIDEDLCLPESLSEHIRAFLSKDEVSSE